MGRIKHRVSHLSALAFALSFPLQVLQLNPKLTLVMHLLKEGEQGLPAPRALGRQCSLCAQQEWEKERERESQHQLCTLYGRQQQHLPPLQRGAPLFHPFKSFLTAMADNSKATWSGASWGRYYEEEPCSETTRVLWKFPLLPLRGHSVLSLMCALVEC